MTDAVIRNTAATSGAQLERFYRKQILKGELPPGSKLPSNQEMAKIWSIRTSSVQKALSNLAAEGLLERRQSRGTFVCDPEHRALIGILLASSLVKESSSFYRALCAELQDGLDGLYLSSRVYDNLLPANGKRAGDRFAQDVKNHHFKGFIMVGTAPLQKRGMFKDLAPKAVFQDTTRDDDALVDYRHFIDETFTQLSERGYKRVAYLSAVMPEPSEPGYAPPQWVADSLKAHSDISASVWTMKFTREHLSVEHEAISIFEEWKRKRIHIFSASSLPDAIVVPDDIIARALVMFLLKNGVRIPEDVKICVLASKGINICYSAPVFKYEIAVDQLAGTLIDRLFSRISGNDISPDPVMIRGTFCDLQY